jgi:hypothetical protein
LCWRVAACPQPELRPCRIPNGPLPDYGLFEPSWEADWILWLDSRTPADPQEAAHAIVKAFRSTSRPPGGTGRQAPLDRSVTRLPRELAGVGVDPNRELVVLTHEPFAQ